MSREEILVKVNEIFADAFDRDDLEITEATVASDVAGWDSLMQMNIIEMVEDEFEIRFEMNEIVGLKNVGDMITSIAAHI